MYGGCILQELPTEEFYPCMHSEGPWGLKTMQKGFPWSLGRHVAAEWHRHLATLGASTRCCSRIGWGREGQGKLHGLTFHPPCSPEATWPLWNTFLFAPWWGFFPKFCFVFNWEDSFLATFPLLMLSLKVSSLARNILLTPYPVNHLSGTWNANNISLFKKKNYLFVWGRLALS